MSLTSSTPLPSPVSLTRRTLLSAGLAAASTVALTVPRADAAPAFVTRRARSSEYVRRTFGTNVKCGYDLAGYSNASYVADALDELGTIHVRDAIWKNRPDIWKAFNLLEDRGIRINLVTGRPTFEGGTPEQLVADVANHCAGAVRSFEGANEWNLKRRPGWVAELRTHQRRLYEAVKANPTVEHLPVLGPAMGQRKDRDAVGDLSDYLDRGNNHLYGGGRVPSRYVDQELQRARAISRSKKVRITESGYHNALNDRTTHLPTSEAAAATYMPRLLMEYAKRGVERIHSYELIDQGRSSSDREQSFGLIRQDGARKPAFVAMRRLIDLMRDPGPSFTTGSLTYALTGGDELTSCVLLQRRNGRFLLAVWQDTEIWDPRRKTAVSATARKVTLSFSQSRLLTLYRPSVAERAVKQMRATSMALSLTGDLQVLAVDALPSGAGAQQEEPTRRTY